MAETVAMKTMPSILMIVENYFPSDTRVKKEAESLKKYYDVTVIALRRGSERRFEIHEGIRIIRVPELKRMNLGGRNNIISRILDKMYYIIEYSYFTICSAAIFLLTYFRYRYKVIHAHNPPDTLFLVGLLGKIVSTRFVFDHHDLSPELYLTRFSKKKDILFRMLCLLEKFSCKLADVVISTNNSYREIVMSRHGIAAEKIFVVRNDPVLSEFYYEMNRTPTLASGNNKNVLLYLGSINPQDGLDILVMSLHYLVHELKERDFVCNIIGDGDSLGAVRQLANDLGLTEFINFTGYIDDRIKIKDYLAQSDICVESAPENELNRHSTFIKIMEYMAAAKPIVAFDLSETRFSTDGAALLVKSGDIAAFANKLKSLMNDPALREHVGRRGHERVRDVLNWGNASGYLISAYESIRIH